MGLEDAEGWEERSGPFMDEVGMEEAQICLCVEPDAEVDKVGRAKEEQLEEDAAVVVELVSELVGVVCIEDAVLHEQVVAELPAGFREGAEQEDGVVETDIFEVLSEIGALVDSAEEVGYLSQGGLAAGEGGEDEGLEGVAEVGAGPGETREGAMAVFHLASVRVAEMGANLPKHLGGHVGEHYHVGGLC